MTNQEGKKADQQPANVDTHSLEENLKNGYESAKNKSTALLEETGEQAKKYATAATSKTVDYIEKNPLTAITIAALAGLSLALLLCK